MSSSLSSRFIQWWRYLYWEIWFTSWARQSSISGFWKFCTSLRGSESSSQALGFKIYMVCPSIWQHTHRFGWIILILVTIEPLTSDLYWIFLSGKSLGTHGRVYISPFRDFQHTGNLNCQSTNIYNTTRNVFFFPTHWNNCGSWFWRRNKEIIGKKMRFCCDNAYSLTTRIMSNETSIFFYPQLFGHFFFNKNLNWLVKF